MGSTTARTAQTRVKGSVQRVVALVDSIRSYCSAHQDLSKLPKWQRYFREGFDSWGLLDKNDPLWTTKKGQWLDEFADIGVDGFIDSGSLLFSSGKYEEGSLAIHFVTAYMDQLTALEIRKLGAWFQAGIANWAHTDVLCGMILSPMLQRGALGISELEQWRTSPYKFQRRAVPVAMLGLLKTKATTSSLLRFIAPLMLDDERVVHQGLGWFLREAWKRERAPVERFLLEWKDQAPRLIFQYATEKMTAAERARFKKTR
jgi:3-methyladenine DNA glycosylase AlkD